MKSFYNFCMPEEFALIIPTDLIRWLHTSVEVDIRKLVGRPTGLGVFIRENLAVRNETGVNIAVVAEWKTVQMQYVVNLDGSHDKIEIKFLRYHIFKGDMPDAMLDDINFVKKHTKDPVWT